jgi:hypothetical protein
MKNLLSLMILIGVFACQTERQKEIVLDAEPIQLDGYFWSDNLFFPNDTLVLHKFHWTHTIEDNKLILFFKNDSIYLDKHTYNGWDGKWFCDFYSAQFKYDDGVLALSVFMQDNLSCANTEIERFIDYQQLEESIGSLTLVKTRDTSNCIRTFQVPPPIDLRGRGSTHPPTLLNPL